MNEIHILLVEDEAPKIAHIECFLKELGTNLNVTVARSVSSALDALEDKNPNLLILDMSLPTFDVGERESGGRPQGFGGIEVLRHMIFSEILCPTIVITGYEAFLREAGNPVDLPQIRAELMSEFHEILKGVFHYNSTYDQWKIELGKSLRELGFISSSD